MGEARYKEWIDNSMGIKFVEMLIIGEVQGLGILDCELLDELSKLNLDSRLNEDLAKRARYILLSKLWVIGAYETIRLFYKMTENNSNINEDTKKKIEGSLREFDKVRVPLAKFEKRGGKEKIYSGVPDSFIDKDLGVGWKIYEHHKDGLKTEIYYRKDLGDKFLGLLKVINDDIRSKLISGTGDL